MNIWILKILPCQKRLIDKLALECEDKILNTTEPLLNDKKWHVQKAIILFTLFHW